MAVVGDVFGPAVAALTLGLYARKLLARRMGRNSAFDHAGNVAIALIAGAVGYAFSQRAVFLLVPVFALLTVIAVLSIPGQGHRLRPGARPRPRARRGGQRPGVAGYGILFKSPAAGHVRPVRHAVPFRQCAAAAAGGTEARRRLSQGGDGDDVGLHHRRAGGDAADRPPGRAQRRQLGDASRCFSPASPSCRSARCSTRCRTTASG